MGCCCAKSAEDANTTTTVSNIVQSSSKPLTPEPPPVVSALVLKDSGHKQVGVSTTDPNKVIQGYENEQLVSLEQALQPFDGQIPRLQEQIKQAKTQCNRSTKHNLTHDESAALYLYSMTNDPDSVRHHLDRAWQTNDRSQMKSWFPYLKLLRSALNKLPNADGPLWQGISHNPDVENMFKANDQPLFTLLDSSSKSKNAAKQSLERQGVSQMIFIEYDTVGAKDATGYLAGDGNGIMILPGTKLKKSKITHNKTTGSLTVHLKCTQNDAESPTKHFICPVSTCGNTCGGDHPPNRCHGFIILQHSCSHHCGPLNSCAGCNKEDPNLKQCTRCHRILCEECCFK